MQEHYVTVHQHLIEDASGNLVDVRMYCSDYCHRKGEGENYRGWFIEEVPMHEAVAGRRRWCRYCQGAED